MTESKHHDSNIRQVIEPGNNRRLLQLSLDGFQQKMISQFRMIIKLRSLRSFNKNNLINVFKVRHKINFLIGFHIGFDTVPLISVVDRQNNILITSRLGCLYLLLHSSNWANFPFKTDLPRHYEVSGKWEVEGQRRDESRNRCSRARSFHTPCWFLDVDMNPAIKLLIMDF